MQSHRIEQFLGADPELELDAQRRFHGDGNITCAVFDGDAGVPEAESFLPWRGLYVRPIARKHVAFKETKIK